MTASVNVDPQHIRRDVARWFRSCARARRQRYAHSSYQPERLLSLWCSWEDTRDALARQVADAVVNGHTDLVANYAAQYSVAVARMDVARWRYVATQVARGERR